MLPSRNICVLFLALIALVVATEQEFRFEKLSGPVVEEE